MTDLVIAGGTVVTPEGPVVADVAIADGRIEGVGPGLAADGIESIDANDAKGGDDIDFAIRCLAEIDEKMLFAERVFVQRHSTPGLRGGSNRSAQTVFLPECSSVKTIAGEEADAAAVGIRSLQRAHGRTCDLNRRSGKAREADDLSRRRFLQFIAIHPG